MVARDGSDHFFATPLDVACPGKEYVFCVADIGRRRLLFTCFSHITGATVVGAEGEDFISGVAL